ncbi:MAG: alpha/beta hydrolase [Saccharofermentanales bacterium]|nr:alpha/beta hydrolase [Bacillota bacterium]
MQQKKRFKPLFVLAAMLVLILLTVILLGAVSFIRADRIMNLTATPLEPFAANIIGKHQNISFRSSQDQFKLNGWWLPSLTQTAKGTIILIHDRGKNRLQFGLETHKLYNFLTEEGFNVLSFDQRGSGESSSGLHAYGYNAYEDVLAALKYAKTRTPKMPLLLMGFGAGNSAIWQAWSKLPVHDNAEADEYDEIVISRQDIGAIIMDTPVRSTEDCIISDINSSQLPAKWFFRWSIPLTMRLSAGNAKNIDFLELILEAHCPIYLTKNKFDQVYAQENTETLFNETKRLRSSTTSISVTEGSGHVTGWLDYQGTYKDSLREFLRFWFGH